MRKRLPDTRDGATQKFQILARAEDGSTQEIEGYIQSGLYSDGRLGEIFVKVGKAGSTEALFDHWAIAVSVALQHGAPVEELMKKFTFTRFEPSGAVKSVEGIKRCTSPLDLVARWILSKYGKNEGEIVEDAA